MSDLVTASYNLTMMQPTTASASTSYSATGTRLAKAFATPGNAASFATDVIGDVEVSSCSTTGCPTKATKTSLGLERKAEDEIAVVRPQLATVLTTTVPSTTDLDAASAPGVLVTRDLVDALRGLPKAEQAIAVERISQEVALARTIDRALLVRQMLITGLSIPEALPDPVSDEVQKKIVQVIGDNCLGCGACISACPSKSLSLVYAAGRPVPPEKKKDLFKQILKEKKKMTPFIIEGLKKKIRRTLKMG